MRMSLSQESLAGGSGLAPDANENRTDNAEMAAGAKPTDNGYQPTAEPGETAMASPRLIPDPDSPVHSATGPPTTLWNDSGQTLAPFNRNCAPSRAPPYGSAECDHLSYDQPREPCKQRRYHQ